MFLRLGVSTTAVDPDYIIIPAKIERIVQLLPILLSVAEGRVLTWSYRRISTGQELSYVRNSGPRFATWSNGLVTSRQ
jgi:hypothetical protein